MSEKNRPVVAADAVDDIHDVAETLCVLHDEVLGVLTDSPVAAREILSATLSSQIDNLDKIGLSLAEEFDKAEYEPVAAELREEKERASEEKAVTETPEAQDE